MAFFCYHRFYVRPYDRRLLAKMHLKLISVLILAAIRFAFGHQSSIHGHSSPIMISNSLSEERSHIQHHMEDMVGVRDINEMAEDELRFMYFKMHDTDDNNKLDGCELVKSLLHWHVEEQKSLSPLDESDGTTKIFRNEELSLLIDPIFATDDGNCDGFIDYPEFVAAHKYRGF